ncbi:MAG: VCBS repeat-containing protein [Saprospiraceae bacterium]
MKIILGQIGVNYTSSNFVAQDTFPSAAGCDSIVTLNLTINYATSSTQNASSCGNYTWPVNGTNYTKSGSYEYYLTTTGGCDSLITLALIITQPNISIIEFTKEHNASFQGVQSSSIAFADVDSDGDLDVVLTGDSIVECGLYKIAKQYSNDGNGLFTEVIGSPFEGVGESSIAFADINGDGDQDLLITGTNTQHIKVAKLYSNNGKRIIPIVTAWE